MADHGLRGYVEYREGNVDIIITAGHGGLLEPKDIPDRTEGNAVYDGPDELQICVKEDRGTRDLAIEVSKKLVLLYNIKPHLILNNVKRRKVDVNRPIDIGANGNSKACQIWSDYHEKIEDATNRVSGDSGLLIDIHGHSHKDGWIELGYGLSKRELNRQTYKIEESTIGILAVGLLQSSLPCRAVVGLNNPSTSSRLAAKVNFDDLLHGKESFGGLLEDFGYKAVPSPSFPSPKKGSYFSGGYSVRTHGSSNGTKIAAIQVESPLYLRKNGARATYAENLARVIMRFATIYLAK